MKKSIKKLNLDKLTISNMSSQDMDNRIGGKRISVTNSIIICRTK